MEPHLIHVSRYSDSRGTLGVIDKDIFDEYNFETHRCFYISDVLEDGSRGAHAHLHCTQIILLTSGVSKKVLLAMQHNLLLKRG